jgi:protein-S-isoprenylcysteine O-methyltransferase Ste14
MDIKKRLTRLLQPRFAILYPLGLYLGIFAHPSDQSIILAIPFVLSGILMRLWSNGYAIKMGKLTTSGPYALVRNPLYLGTALIVLGFIVMLKIFIVGALFLGLMAWVYRNTIHNEEKRLTECFGEAYLDYKKHVPGLFPTLIPYKTGAKWSFSWQRLWESREHKISLWIPIIMIGFHLKDELLVEHEPVDRKIILLISIIVILGLLDMIGEIARSLLDHKEA